MQTVSVNLPPAKNPNQIEQRLNVSLADIIGFCQRWQITELAVFGSILREDFKADSDLDFLVTFAPDANIGLFDLYDLEEELKSIVGRDVDVVFKNSIASSKNWIRRRNILSTAEVIYGKG
jgi:predicted nucleotidyltransferase